jgi:hypothetical protein
MKMKPIQAQYIQDGFYASLNEPKQFLAKWTEFLARPVPAALAPAAQMQALSILAVTVDQLRPFINFTGAKEIHDTTSMHLVAAVADPACLVPRCTMLSRVIQGALDKGFRITPRQEDGPETAPPKQPIEVKVSLENMPTPRVNVLNNVQPAEISKVEIIGMPDRQTSSDVEYDSRGNITRTVQTERDL